MKISAFIMGICSPHRLSWLDQNIKHLDCQGFPFHKKYLVIDEFDGNTFPTIQREQYEGTGWNVIVRQYHSRMKAMDSYFEADKDSDIVFYNEDDVLSTMPSMNDIENIFSIKDNKNRQLGMLSMTLGGTQFDYSLIPPNLGDLAYINNETLLENTVLGYRIFRRNEQYANNYFFEFPGLFISRALFESLHRDCQQYFKFIQIEQALTKAWFATVCSRKYYKASICKHDTLYILQNNARLVNSHCRLLQNLDPNQGNSGGNCVYH